MSHARLQQIRAEVRAATPGPWQMEFVSGEGPKPQTVMIAATGPGRHVRATRATKTHPAEDATFIAGARDHIPYLLNLLERQEAELAAAQEALGQSRRACARTGEDHDLSQAKLQALENEKTTLTTALARAQAANDRLTSERDIAAHSLAESRGAVSQLTRERDGYQAQARQAQAERDDAYTQQRTTIAELTERLAQTEHAARTHQEQAEQHRQRADAQVRKATTAEMVLNQERTEMRKREARMVR